MAGAVTPIVIFRYRIMQFVYHHRAKIRFSSDKKRGNYMMHYGAGYHSMGPISTVTHDNKIIVRMEGGLGRVHNLDPEPLNYTTLGMVSALNRFTDSPRSRSGAEVSQPRFSTRSFTASIMSTCFLRTKSGQGWRPPSFWCAVLFHHGM